MQYQFVKRYLSLGSRSIPRCLVQPHTNFRLGSRKLLITAALACSLLSRAEAQKPSFAAQRDSAPLDHAEAVIRGFAAADLNRDGYPDLVLATQDDIYTTLGDGKGNVALGWHIAADRVFAGTFWSLAVGDLNGDGKPDLVTTGCNSTQNGGIIGVYLGTGNGYDFGYGYNNNISSCPDGGVALGDFNGDGKLDVATADYSSGTVSILIGGGNGTLQLVHTYTVGGAPTAIAVNDFNGDGVLDIAVTNSKDNSVSVLLGIGEGSFRTIGTFPVGGSPTALAAGDLNGDGIPDLAITTFDANSNNVSVLLGKGDGTFQLSNSYWVGYGPNSISIGDLNNDGIPDLAVTNDGLTTLLGNGDGTFRIGSFYYQVGEYVNHVALADFNGDGTSDIAVGTCVNFGLTTPCRASVLLGNSDGTVQGTPAIALFSSDAPLELVAADFNNDSITDLAVVASNANVVRVLQGVGDGSFQLGSGAATGSTPRPIVAADFNNDGIPDLAVGNSGSGDLSIILGNGDGTFKTSTRLPVGPRPISLIAVDFNNDGNTDIAVALEGSNSLLVLLGDGSGGFQAGSSYGLGNDPQRIVAGDFNRDGISDLAVANYYSNDISILIGNGDGTFRSAPAVTVGGPDCRNLTSLAAADLNSDGTMDLAVTCSSNNFVKIMLGNGDGSFRPSYRNDGSGAAGNWTGGDYPQSIAVADFNGDGNPDLVVANYTSDTLGVLLGNGDGTFQAPTIYGVAVQPWFVAVADLNGDGKPDIAISDRGDDRVSILLNTTP